MEQPLFILLSIILIIIGIAGTILPVLPGLLLSFAGILLYKFFGNPEFSIIYVIIGLFFPPIGFIIGMLLGVFLGELIHDRTDKKKAFNATKGAFLGFIYGTGFNLLVGLAMFLVVLIDIFTK